MAAAKSIGKRLGVLIDLSGTLHVEDELIPGTIHAINKLRKLSNVKFKFVTNTSKESGKNLHNRLIKLGIDAKAENLFTSLSATKRLIQQRNLQPRYALENVALEEFKDIDTTYPNAVVIALAPSHFHYERLTEAFRLVLNGAPLIAVNKGRYYKRKDGLALGPGAFVQAIEFATDAKAEVVGKPSKSFFLTAMASVDESLCVDDVIMIGDDVRDDVAGAQRVGMKGVLVKTGKYMQGDEDSIEPRPFMAVDTFAHAVQWICEHYT